MPLYPPPSPFAVPSVKCVALYRNESGLLPAIKLASMLASPITPRCVALPQTAPPKPLTGAAPLAIFPITMPPAIWPPLEVACRFSLRTSRSEGAMRMTAKARREPKPVMLGWPTIGGTKLPGPAFWKIFIRIEAITSKHATAGKTARWTKTLRSHFPNPRGLPGSSPVTIQRGAAIMYRMSMTYALRSSNQRVTSAHVRAKTTMMRARIPAMKPITLPIAPSMQFSGCMPVGTGPSQSIQFPTANPVNNPSIRFPTMSAMAWLTFQATCANPDPPSNVHTCLKTLSP